MLFNLSEILIFVMSRKEPLCFLQKIKCTRHKTIRGQWQQNLSKREFIAARGVWDLPPDRRSGA